MIYSLAFYLKLVLKVAVLAGPFFATCFSRSTYWSCHFLISLSLTIWIIFLLAGVFRLQSQDASLRRTGEIPSDIDRIASEELHDDKFSQLTVHLLALFLVVYISVEVKKKLEV